MIELIGNYRKIPPSCLVSQDKKIISTQLQILLPIHKQFLGLLRNKILT